MLGRYKVSVPYLSVVVYAFLRVWVREDTRTDLGRGGPVAFENAHATLLLLQYQGEFKEPLAGGSHRGPRKNECFLGKVEDTDPVDSQARGTHSKFTGQNKDSRPKDRTERQ